MKEPVIESLVATLKPVRRLDNSHLWALAGIAFAACAIWVLTAYGLRPQLQNLSAMADPMPIIKPLVLMGVAVLATIGTAHMARPDGQVPLWVKGGIAVIAGVLLAGAVWDGMTNGRGFWAPLSEPFILCWIVTLNGGAISYAVIWALWLRRTAPANPIAFGAMSGLAVSALMAAAYTLHCDRDMPLYIMVFYGAPLVVMAFAGAVAGRWLYRW